MEIKKEKENMYTCFGELDNGEIFEFEGEVFIKANSDFDIECPECESEFYLDEHMYIAIEVEKGRIQEFAYGLTVTRLRGCLNIYS